MKLVTSEGPWPNEIRVKQAERRLEIDFDDGATIDLSAELLRVESPSAEVQGHVPSQKITLGGKKTVGISRIEPVGNYAIRILFDDQHSTGIYSWPYLYNLGQNKNQIWQRYLEALQSQGLSRDH